MGSDDVIERPRRLPPRRALRCSGSLILAMMLASAPAIPPRTGPSPLRPRCVDQLWPGVLPATYRLGQLQLVRPRRNAMRVATRLRPRLGRRPALAEHPAGRRPLSAAAAQAGLPQALPLAGRLSSPRTGARRLGRFPHGPVTWRLLSRLLLVPHGTAVRRRGYESVLDRCARTVTFLRRSSFRTAICSARSIGLVLAGAGMVILAAWIA